MYVTQLCINLALPVACFVIVFFNNFMSASSYPVNFLWAQTYCINFLVSSCSAYFYFLVHSGHSVNVLPIRSSC